jgi:hypothetical protein
MKIASLEGDCKINSGWKLAWLEKIADHKMLTHLDVPVATYLSRRFNKDRGTTIASYNKIAKAIDCHRVTAINSVGRLITHGFLILHRRGNSFRNEANEYRLCLPDLVAQTAAPSSANRHDLVAQTDSLSAVGVSADIYSFREEVKTVDSKDKEEGSLSGPSGARSPDPPRGLGEEEVVSEKTRKLREAYAAGKIPSIRRAS